MQELRKYEGEVFFVTEGGHGTLPEGQAWGLKWLNVNESFERLSRERWEPLYHKLREFLACWVNDADEHCVPDSQMAQQAQDVRSILIEFGHKDFQADLEAEDWLDRVRGWRF